MTSLSITLVNWLVREALSVTPCSMNLYKAEVRLFERWILYSSYVHVNFIAVDRYVAIKHALHYESRVTPAVIRNLIAAIWLTATWDLCSLIRRPALPRSPRRSLKCVCLSCTLVIVVYTRIWKTVMHSELQQQQPSLAASESGRGNVEHDVHMLCQHRLLNRKHCSTRTIIVILAVNVCLFFPHILFRLFRVTGL